MGCRAGLSPGSRKNYVFILINCGIQCNHCLDLWSRLMTPLLEMDSKSEFQAVVSCPPTGSQQINDVGVGEMVYECPNLVLLNMCFCLKNELISLCLNEGKKTL